MFVDNNNVGALLSAFADLPFLSSAIEGVVNPNIPCLGVQFEWSGVSEAIIVLISGEHFNEAEITALCVREEGFNALGLFGDPQGDASLFSGQRWRGEEWPAPAFWGYGERDYLLMRLFYRPIFESGQLAEETRQEILDIIETECDL